MTPEATIGISEAKTRFNKLTADANETGIPITVFKNNKPWVQILPLAFKPEKGNLPQSTVEAFKEIEELKLEPSTKRYECASQLFEELGL